MQNSYAKNYLYALLGISVANLLFILVYGSMTITAVVLFFLTELIVFIMSIIMIVNIFTKKLPLINLILPIYYIAAATILGAYDIMVVQPITDDMDIIASFLFTIYNPSTFVIDVVDYIFIISFSIYLLRNDELFRQGDE